MGQENNNNRKGKWLRDDPEVVSACVEFSKEEFQYASHRLKNDYQFALKICGSWIKAFPYVSEELRDCKEFVMELYRQCKHDDRFAFECVSERLRDDEDVVRLCCQTGSFLQYANQRFWDDEEIVLAAYKRYYFDKKCISDRLRDNKEFIRKLCSQTFRGLENASA